MSHDYLPDPAGVNLLPEVRALRAEVERLRAALRQLDPFLDDAVTLVGFASEREPGIGHWTLAFDCFKAAVKLARAALAKGEP